jgi:hypothetical protein
MSEYEFERSPTLILVSIFLTKETKGGNKNTSDLNIGEFKPLLAQSA